MAYTLGKLFTGKVPVSEMNGIIAITKIGTEIIAYFSQFRIYRKFIQGNFGTITSTDRESDELALFYPLKCACADNVDNICKVDEDADFTDPSIKPCCVGDYNIYEDVIMKFEINFELYKN